MMQREPRGFIALFTATIIGWCGELAVDLIQLFDLFVETADATNSIEFFIGLYVVYGLPIALLSCGLLVTPIWYVLKNRDMLTTKSATITGLSVGAVLGIFEVGVSASTLTPIGLIIDYLSTVLIGGFAGWAGFKLAQRFGRPIALKGAA